MIYLDHAATTDMLPEVQEAVAKWMRTDCTGNPGSLHAQGKLARDAVEHARQQVADLLEVSPEEIYFTSGGTESNNMWLQCIPEGIVLTTQAEHASILEPTRGRANYLKINRYGNANLDDLDTILDAQWNKIAAVSLMTVNNELGTVNDLGVIGDLCAAYGILFHTDAVQAVGKIPVHPREDGVDMLSMSAHKFGGPMGVGALYIQKDVHPGSLILGGGQEHGLRSGTENVTGIVGMGVAAELAKERLHIPPPSLRGTLYCSLMERDVDFQINSPPKGSPYIASLTFPGVYSETLLLLLDQMGVCVSAGSACSAGDVEPSHVLTAVGMKQEDAACTIRVSFGYSTTVEEVEQAAEAIAQCVKKAKEIL